MEKSKSEKNSHPTKNKFKSEDFGYTSAINPPFFSFLYFHVLNKSPVGSIAERGSPRRPAAAPKIAAHLPEPFNI